MDHREFAKYFNWAEQNRVRIFPIPMTSTGTILKIAIETNGIIKLGEEKHTDKTVATKITQLYKQIYFKNNLQTLKTMRERIKHRIARIKQLQKLNINN